MEAQRLEEGGEGRVGALVPLGEVAVCARARACRESARSTLDSSPALGRGEECLRAHVRAGNPQGAPLTHPQHRGGARSVCALTCAPGIRKEHPSLIPSARHPSRSCRDSERALSEGKLTVLRAHERRGARVCLRWSIGNVAVAAVCGARNRAHGNLRSHARAHEFPAEGTGGGAIKCDYDFRECAGTAAGSNKT